MSTRVSGVRLSTLIDMPGGLWGSLYHPDWCQRLPYQASHLAQGTSYMGVWSWFGRLAARS
jgi:hypothetical protein